LVGGGLQATELSGYYACLDTYEWESPGTGSCAVGGNNYSPQDEGCLYLISSGKSDWPNLFADSSASGNDVFFFSREGLVGQDKDELLDVYDARVGGGIASQNPAPPAICESPDACRPTPPPPGEEATPGSSSFVGPNDPAPKHPKPKKAKHHKKKSNKHHQKKKHRANKGRASR
jgi:hypothetical protein